MNDTLVERIKACPSLPSLPAIAVQVLNLAQSHDVDIQELARTISRDPALSSKILKTVNSSFYGRPQHVATISQALVILGMQSVKTLVLGFSLVSNLSGKKGGKTGFDHMRYWRRSAYAATAARVLSGKAGIVQHEEAFLATLLADIGQLVFDQVLGDEYAHVCEGVAGHDDLLAVETAKLGMSHADVGRLMLESWKLPPLLSVPVASHHDPEQVTDPALKKLTEVVALAGRCADVFVDDSAHGAIQAVRARCAATFGMTDADTDQLLAEIGIKTRDIASLFEINIGSTVQFEQILKRANEALVELTLQSQMRASSLAEQNQQLKAAATTDALTGLGNRQRFDTFLAEQLASSVSGKTPLALILLDLDHFKKVNDTHGHPAGDAVLKQVAKMLNTVVREQDTACRYGGEEMALVLPGLNRAQASGIAETVRRAINAKPIQIDDDGKTLPVSASLGVAVYDPGSPLVTPSHLLKAADLALYNAKHSGRNCVKVFALKAAA
jgi:diguanylate cyclase (GGDEF)-like protein